MEGRKQGEESVKKRKFNEIVKPLRRRMKEIGLQEEDIKNIVHFHRHETRSD